MLSNYCRTGGDLDITGLSGVSDIVGDMLRRGDIDAAQAGMSQQQAQQLQDRAKYVCMCQ